MQIFHNPGCSKSRAALALLEERQIPFQIISYLDSSPDLSTLRELSRCLSLRPKDFCRRQEAAAQGLGIDWEDDEAVFQVMHKQPVLIERPIIREGSRAVIARPIEKLTEFLDELARLKA